jgi:hypothetical protein
MSSTTGMALAPRLTTNGKSTKKPEAAATAGYMCGQEDKKAFILFPDGEPERWDVMYQFADGVYFDTEHLVGHLTDLLDN